MESASSSIKTEDKKSQLRWNSAMDNILLDKLVEAAREGKKSGSKWNNDVWKSLEATLTMKAGKEVRDTHIDNRIRQMRTEYRDFVDLKEKSGLSYDPNKQAVLGSDEQWEGILSIPKDNKRFKVFRERGLKWDIEKLSIIIGNSNATGSYSLNGLDNIETIDVEGGIDLPVTSEPIDLDDDGESMSSASAKKPKRKHGNKTTYVDEVKEMFQSVNTRLESLRETVDPLTFGRQLREKIMEVQGFSLKFLNATFCHLMRDRVEVEIFILSDEEGRVDMLNDLRRVIGNL